MADGGSNSTERGPPRLSHLEQLDLRAILRETELAEQREQGRSHPLYEKSAELARAVLKLEDDRSGAESRARVRDQVAEYLDRTVLPGLNDEKLGKVPAKLRAARQQCWYQLNLTNGRTRTIWDAKAGEPLLCPDDARAEGMRLQRRLEDEVEALALKGFRVYYGVLTIENAKLGGLEARVGKLWRAWRKALKAKIDKPKGDPRRKKDLPKRFPFVGAIATLETPLSASRTWHPHLNVILITRGFFNWSDWWQYWGWVSHFQAIKPGNVAQAFRELVKYAVRAVPEKSAEKATCTSYSSSSFLPPESSSAITANGSTIGARAATNGTVFVAAEDLTCSPLPLSRSSAQSARSSATSAAAASAGLTASMKASNMGSPSRAAASAASSSSSARSPRTRPPPGPALIEWRAEEFCEWWHVMKGHRRTRTYGELFGLNVKPEREKDDAGAWVTIGKAWWAGLGYRVRYELLECIPGDKSILDVRVRFEKWMAALWRPPDGWGAAAADLEKMHQAIQFSAMDR